MHVRCRLVEASLIVVLSVIASDAVTAVLGPGSGLGPVGILTEALPWPPPSPRLAALASGLSPFGQASLADWMRFLGGAALVLRGRVWVPAIVAGIGVGLSMHLGDIVRWALDGFSRVGRQRIIVSLWTGVSPALVAGVITAVVVRQGWGESLRTWWRT